MGQVQPEVAKSLSIPVSLRVLYPSAKSFSTSSNVLAQYETRPPPLIAGSPPQATLRVWLL
jgi:hypothetical protein